MRQQPTLPRVKLPESYSEGNGPAGNPLVPAVSRDDGSGVPPFIQAILRAYARVGKHRGGHAGEFENRVVRNRARNKVAKASRKANR